MERARGRRSARAPGERTEGVTREAAMAAKKQRCRWAGTTDALYLEYHDEEWGVPSHDDRHLFEMLILEGAQAGLSWATSLKKRANYRRADDRLDPRRVAR